MKLLIDIGNSRLKSAWLTPSGLSTAQALDYRQQGIDAALQQIAWRPQAEGVWVASVAGDQADAAIEDWARSHGCALRFATVTTAAAGVTCGYKRVERLGIDRWLAVLAAYRRAGAAALVVDAGTALTLDAVDSAGQHLGGLIAPGVHLMRDAVHGSTRVRTAPVERSGLLLGDDTADAVGLGTLQAALGLIERLVAEVQAEHGEVALYLTGGEAGLLAEYLDADWQLVPELVLEGLALLVPAD